MKRAVLLAVACMMLALTGGSGVSKRPEHFYGPAPEWLHHRQVGKTAITASLFDPGSAQIQWVGLYHKGFFRPFLQAKVEGYVTLGMVIARVNGIALAGLGDAMLPLLAADSPTLAIETVTGQHVVLPKAP